MAKPSKGRYGSVWSGEANEVGWGFSIGTDELATMPSCMPVVSPMALHILFHYSKVTKARRVMC